MEAAVPLAAEEAIASDKTLDNQNLSVLLQTGFYTDPNDFLYEPGTGYRNCLNTCISVTSQDRYAIQNNSQNLLSLSVCDYDI